MSANVFTEIFATGGQPHISNSNLITQIFISKIPLDSLQTREMFIGHFKNINIYFEDYSRIPSVL